MPGLSKSNVYVTLKMFLKFQGRFVGSKYFMNLSLQLQFAYWWYCLKSSPLCWVTGQLFAATVANLIFLVASEVLIFIHCHALPHPGSSLLPDLSSRIPSGIGSKTNLAVSWPAVISSKIWNFLVYLMICKAWPAPWSLELLPCPLGARGWDVLPAPQDELLPLRTLWGR